MLTKTQQTIKPKPTTLQIVCVFAAGILPYATGLVVLITTEVHWLALVGVAVCFCSTIGAFLLRRIANPVAAKQWLMADPILYSTEFALSAALTHYVFARS